ncbi:modifier of mdg4 isoform X3 [Bradysia coprophila]|uniref:modifier of mdg4 isoform X3 n=1 Tax=Bradysia coprophila TaxID=38358 RepID=UPI00187D73AF|nr:modifier of mdg4 isoform X3 [Bradysia coprophila]
MADEEQFSLCWNNFNSNLSAGFHESLCRGDLVDVTLAAEGQLVKAHRLVLSVCSPYFRKMFTQMPANQHAFVFLKDVSHAALKDLIQFMYCGEVNVKQDALPTFISTAEALQIKGLTETGEPATPASSQTPVKVSTPAPSVASTTATTSPRSRVQRNISRTSYKLESEDSSDDKPAPVVAQKRLISRSITPVTAPALKRTKNSDPLEASEPTSQQQIITTIETKSNAEETEFIDLPMETMPTKSEPDYGDDTGEVEAVDQDTTYVEDDSGDYGDMKYDSSYFTENDDVKAGASGFAEPYAETGDQSANEAQDDQNIDDAHDGYKTFFEICTIDVDPVDWDSIVDGKHLKSSYVQFFVQQLMDKQIPCVLKSNGYYKNKNSFTIRFECNQLGCRRKYQLKQIPNSNEFVVRRNSTPISHIYPPTRLSQLRRPHPHRRIAKDTARIFLRNFDQ